MLKGKPHVRIIFLCLFIISLSSWIIYPAPVSGGNLQWSWFNIPSNGVGGKWVLAEGSDVRYPTLAPDGTLYCYANPNGTTFRLFKSIDNGLSWSYTGRAAGVMVDIAVNPSDSNLVYYATESNVYGSSDAGNNVSVISQNPGGAGTSGRQITSIDSTSANGKTFIVIGVRDVDASQFGGVYILEVGQPSGLQNTGMTNLDVYSVAFSPDYAADGQIIAVATNEQETLITTKFPGTGWGLKVGDAYITERVPASAAIAFPEDYNSAVSSGKYIQFLALNTGTGNGDVFRITGMASPAASTITDLNIGKDSALSNLDVTSLAVSGNIGSAFLMAGASASTAVYRSSDGGNTWSTCQKPPSGSGATFVLVAAGGAAFAATGGPESAFSFSRDGGVTWAQASLIDTRISTILDLAVSPDYSQDKTLFMLTANVQSSVWRSINGGQQWERVYFTTPERGDRVSRILLSPQFRQNRKLFMAGALKGNPVIWKSDNQGQSFIRNNSLDPKTGSSVNIDAWALAPGDVLFVASFDGSQGSIYHTASGQLNYVDKAAAGSQIFNTLVVSPDYDNDHTLVAGNISGDVFYSNDSGLVFELLPFGSVVAPLSGKITLAFDSDYGRNKTIYAASDTLNKGIYRFNVGKSNFWESIDHSLPAGAKIGQLAASSSGGLYAVNTQTVNLSTSQGGMERCLDPAVSSTPSFGTVTSGLTDGIVLKGLWISNNLLWTIDLTNARLLNYTDSLGSPVALTSPANGAVGLNTKGVNISWKPLSDTVSYHWQVSANNQFLEIPAGFEGDTGLTSTSLPILTPGATYYWRVRCAQPVAGPWSNIWSFSTGSVSGLAPPDLLEPKSTTLSSTNPIFKWTISEGAERYDLQVSRDDAFHALVVNKTGNNACNTNVWKCEIALDYNTGYYWRVRAVAGANQSPWSEVNAFTTKNAPTGPGIVLPPVPSPTSVPLLAPKLSDPRMSSSVSVQPLFKWSVSTGAEKYELQVSRDDAFQDPVIDKSGEKACNANAWVCDIFLEPATSYYWKVRAVAGTNVSPWSEVNIFTTETVPTPTASPKVSISPTSVSPTPTAPKTVAQTPSPTVPRGTIAAAATTSSSPTTSKTTISSPAATSSPGATSSSITLLFFLVGGLIFLTAILIGVIVVMMRRFRHY